MSAQRADPRRGSGESPGSAHRAGPPRGSGEFSGAAAGHHADRRGGSAGTPDTGDIDRITAAQRASTRRLGYALLASVVLAAAGVAYLAAAVVDDAAAPSAPVVVVAPPPVPAVSAPDTEKPRPRARGSLTLVTTPEATVRLKGKVLGKTPFFELPLDAGTHLLELTGPDGKVKVLSAPIKSGAPTRFRLKLSDLPSRR